MEKRCYGCMRLKQQSPICEHCGFNEQIDNLPHQLPLGTVLRGQYLVGKVLGQGGFGITYMGWDLNLEIPVAIKEFYPNSVVNRSAAQSNSVICGSTSQRETFAHNRERFLREARTLARLREVPGIVSIYNFFQENNTAYIVMEYVSGIDLRRYLKLRGGRMDPRELLQLLHPVMRALDKVHAAGLVHRDISPDNIMIQSDGSAKLLDFGAVREVSGADAGAESASSTEAILKHGFAPLEQYRRRGSLGPWTDVYALCASIYYCLTGSVPADAPERIMGDDNVNWNRIPGLTAAQIAALEQGMAVMPDQRTPSIAHLEAALYGDAKVVVPEPEYGTTVPVTKEPELPPMPRKADPPKSQIPKAPAEPRSVPQSPPELGKKKPWALVGVLAAVVVAAAVMLLPGGKEAAPQPQSQSQSAAASDSWRENLLMPDPNQAEWEALPGYPVFGTQIRRQDVESVTFLDSLEGAATSCWDVSKNADGSVLAWAEKTDSGLYDLYIAAEGGVNGQYGCAGLFCGYSNLKRIDFGGCFHTELASDLNSMFQGCTSLTQLDATQLNTASARDMGWMFLDCESLTELDVTGFDTSNVTNMKAMFDNCARLRSLDVSGFDTAKVEDMSFLFGCCLALTELDLSSFDTSSVLDMSYMFLLCQNLKELDLAGFQTGYVVDMSSMFESCDKLEKLNISSLQTNRVRSMNRMFAGCQSLQALDVSKFDTGLVQDMNCMFLYCSSLTELDVSSFNTEWVSDMSGMFFGCTGVKNWDLKHFNTDRVTAWENFMDNGVQVNGKPWEKLFQ